MRRENEIFVEQDRAILLRLGDEAVSTFELCPRPLNATHDEVYGESEGVWVRSKASCIIRSRITAGVTVTATVGPINACHSVFVYCKEKQLLYVMHVSPHSSRRGYDISSKMALDKKYFNDSGHAAVNLFGHAGPSNSDVQTTNNIKPAYIDIDPAHLRDDQGSSEAKGDDYPCLEARRFGLESTDSVDIIVVYTEISSFVRRNLIDRINAVCGINSITCLERERKSLNVNFEHGNEFYEVSLTINLTKPDDSVLEIRGINIEIIRQPFSSQNPEVIQKNCTHRGSRFMDFAPAQHRELNSAGYKEGTLAHLLVSKYRYLPKGLTGSCFINCEIGCLIQGEDSFSLSQRYNGWRRLTQKTKTIIATTLFKYAYDQQQLIKLINPDLAAYADFPPNPAIFYKAARESYNPELLRQNVQSRVDRVKVRSTDLNEQVKALVNDYLNPSWPKLRNRHHLDRAKKIEHHLGKAKTPYQIANLFFYFLIQLQDQRAGYKMFGWMPSCKKVVLNPSGDFILMLAAGIKLCEERYEAQPQMRA